MSYLSVDEAARLFKIHPNTVRNLILNGRLSAIKIGSHYRIPEESIKAFNQNAAVTFPEAP